MLKTRDSQIVSDCDWVHGWNSSQNSSCGLAQPRLACKKQTGTAFTADVQFQLVQLRRPFTRFHPPGAIPAMLRVTNAPRKSKKDKISTGSYESLHGIRHTELSPLPTLYRTPENMPFLKFCVMTCFFRPRKNGRSQFHPVHLRSCGNSWPSSKITQPIVARATRAGMVKKRYASGPDLVRCPEQQQGWKLQLGWTGLRWSFLDEKHVFGGNIFRKPPYYNHISIKPGDPPGRILEQNRIKPRWLLFIRRKGPFGMFETLESLDPNPEENSTTSISMWISNQLLNCLASS